MLEEGDFSDPYSRDTSDDDYFAREFLTNKDTFYTNKCLSVFIANFNDYEDYNKKHGYVDYWEETP